MGRMPANPALLDDAHGEIFLDARGPGRALRLTWHPQAELVVLSLWRDGTCAGTFRLSRDDVGDFVDALVDGLRDAPGVHLPPRDRTGISGPTPASPPSHRAAAEQTTTGTLRTYGDHRAAAEEPAGFFDMVLSAESAEPRPSGR